ncbi:TetR/AcrR family transcriptional regulator [Collimonas sp. OK307]|uniref:TetR/AcrR family transcriptional regulator n=1 Tax=Collimonas sp. OK307 TaxID=1801620 RepID=UPI000B803489|nr:TetR/AcrR family transcriptional regulator [Collimonas sp. OK307]
MTTLDILERNFPGRRAALKRDILLGALACFNQNGLGLTTIEMIKVRCDTSVGSIYHHFGSREGLISALFFSSLEDQDRLLTAYLDNAETAEEGVAAIVYSYVDWVSDEPDLARFQYEARSLVAKGPSRETLTEKNRSRRKMMEAWWLSHGGYKPTSTIPEELLPSIIIGPAESYCRAWLSNRTIASPSTYRDLLAKAAALGLGIPP